MARHQGDAVQSVSVEQLMACCECVLRRYSVRLREDRWELLSAAMYRLDREFPQGGQMEPGVRQGYARRALRKRGVRLDSKTDTLFVV